MSTLDGFLRIVVDSTSGFLSLYVVYLVMGSKWYNDGPLRMVI